MQRSWPLLFAASVTAVIAAIAACKPPAPSLPRESLSAPPSAAPAPATSSSAGGAASGAASASVTPPAPPSPESDIDGDGIPHARDACPREPGKAAEDAAQNGCPRHVRWQNDHIELLTPVKFDIGKPQLHPSSFEVLDEVRDVLLAHKEIAQVEIQGHYPSPPYRALSLNQRRADSVRKYLIDHGVDASRLIAKGYGGDKPLVLPDTEEERARNRRIEIHFVPTSGQGR